MNITDSSRVMLSIMDILRYTLQKIWPYIKPLYYLSQYIYQHHYIISAHNVDTNKTDLIVKMLKHFHLIVVVSHKVTSLMCINY